MNTERDGRRDAAWRILLVGVLVSFGASLLAWRQDAGVMAGWLASVSWVVAWIVLARFRWFTVQRPRVWLVFLTLGWALAFAGGFGAFLGMVVGVAFMLRQQGTIRLLSSRFRALVFLLGFPVLVASFAAGMGRPEGLAGNLVTVARTGVQAFWLSTTLTLLFNMRLHFLRLRPKLVVSGVLLGVIPMALLIVFGVLLLYVSQGGSRASRARDVFEVWSHTYAAGHVPGAFAGDEVTWTESDATADPAWLPDLVAAWSQHREEPDADADDLNAETTPSIVDSNGSTGSWVHEINTPTDATFWLRRSNDLWLVRLRDTGPGAVRVGALSVDAGVFENLAHHLRADVSVGNKFIRDDWDEEQEEKPLDPLTGHFRPAVSDTTANWWQRPWYFGGALVPAVELEGGQLHDISVLLVLKTSANDLVDDMFGVENDVTKGLMVVLGILAVMLMITGLVALIFSGRITGGITGAVKALHRGTRRIAGGDLDTTITIDNEDEFGDLAQSFNEMTVAVKQGREDALARERLQQEMETARKIQERLLPSDQPLLAGWEVTGVSIPSLQVGGDYFDFVSPATDRLGIAIGDVSGKGVPAALLMSNLQACLKGQVMHPAPVADTVTRINDLLSESTDAHMFATFLYGELDVTSGRFTCTNAGHDPALVVRRDGAVEWLTSNGLILGMFAEQEYTQASVALEPGDILVLYTDGITEAGAPTPVEIAEFGEDEVEDTEFGEERLADVVVAAREQPALGIRESVLAAVHDHLGDRPQGDDITLVVLKRGEELAPARGDGSTT